MYNNKRELDTTNIKVERLTEREGVFTPESGQEYRYKNYEIEFTINGYPLIFKAKVDKTLKDYVSVAEEYNA